MVCFVGLHHLLGTLFGFVAAADPLDGEDVMHVRCVVDAEDLEPWAAFISVAFVPRVKQLFL